MSVRLISLLTKTGSSSPSGSTKVACGLVTQMTLHVIRLKKKGT